MSAHSLPNHLSAAEAARRIRARELTSVELTRACLAQIEQLERRVNAWAYLDPESALRQAAAVDRKVEAGEPVGPLAGVPVGVKDIFNTKDMPTEMGSPIWAGFTPGNDARVVHYLRLADAVIPGKTITAEFAVHAPGPTKNPHNPEYMPGTSSSGSAVAVASFMTPLALGTQTAGSTIRPASYCGVYGCKPSFGLLPRTAMLKTTDSLDTIGYFARTAEDLALLFDVIRVRGADYPITEAALNDPSRQVRGDRPWRVALVRGPKWDCAESYAQAALLGFADTLRKLDDVIVEEVEAPQSLNRAHAVHSLIYDRTLAYYFKEEFKKHTLVSPIMYEIIRRGNETDVDDYKRALAEQAQIRTELDAWFTGGWDILLNLSTGGSALKGLESEDRPDNCLVWTLCGVPAINVPVFIGPDDLPFGAQVVARRYNDYLLLDFVRWLRERGLAPDTVHPIPRLAERQKSEG